MAVASQPGEGTPILKVFRAIDFSMIESSRKHKKLSEIT
jgi:hypothetical protein